MMQQDRVFIITGPPGAGKSTFARSHAGPGDIVIDVDYLAAALKLTESIPADYSDVLSAVVFIRDALIKAISTNQLTYGRAFIVTTQHAKRIQDQTGGKIITIDPGADETFRRIEADQTRSLEQQRRRKDIALKYYYSKRGKKP